MSGTNWLGLGVFGFLRLLKNLLSNGLACFWLVTGLVVLGPERRSADLGGGGYDAEGGCGLRVVHV